MFCSVAMSTYNGERFLAEQLSSICAQTRPVDEIVVSDDGSSDGTLRILDDFRLAHPQIHWKILPSAENHGFRESFLRALKACGGDLIFLCDQDDRWAPGKVETMLHHFEANPAMLSLISDFKTIDADGNLLNPNAPTENLWGSDRVLRAPASPTQITLSEMLGRNQGQGCAMAVRRELAQEYIRLNQLWTHDWILNLLAALHGGLYYCREPLLFYRLHGSNVIGMAQGDVKDDLLTVYCSTEVQKSMLDQKVVTDVLSEVTSRAVGREIRVRFLVGERPGAKKRDKMQDLLRMGSKFDNFTVK